MLPARLCYQGLILHEEVGEGALFPFESYRSSHNISAEMNVVIDSWGTVRWRRQNDLAVEVVTGKRRRWQMREV